MPIQSEPSRVDRLRSAILAAARCADLAAMHDAIVAYHQLLGIEEGEPDPARQGLARKASQNAIDVSGGPSVSVGEINSMPR
jgi:hypothetical protein